MKLFFEYPQMNKVMRILKQHQIDITSQKMELSCELEIAVQKSRWTEILQLFEEMQKVTAKRIP